MHILSLGNNPHEGSINHILDDISNKDLEARALQLVKRLLLAPRAPVHPPPVVVQPFFHDGTLPLLLGEVGDEAAARAQPARDALEEHDLLVARQVDDAVEGGDEVERPVGEVQLRHVARHELEAPRQGRVVRRRRAAGEQVRPREGDLRVREVVGDDARAGRVREEALRHGQPAAAA